MSLKVRKSADRKSVLSVKDRTHCSGTSEHNAMYCEICSGSSCFSGGALLKQSVK